MKLKDLVAVSGLPGLYKTVASRSNGLVVEEIDSGKTRFLSVRKHQFTPLETVAIYTNTDSTELQEVFNNMKSLSAELTPPPVSSPTPELFAYFAKILPDYDPDRVLISDVKKVIKWFNFLENRALLHDDEEE